MTYKGWLEMAHKCPYRITESIHDINSYSAQTIQMVHIKYHNPLCCYGGIGKRCTYNLCNKTKGEQT